MTEYREWPTNVGRLMSNWVSSGRCKVCLYLGLKDNCEGVIINLYNVYYFLNSPCHLVSLGLLNNSEIYHNNKKKTLYHVKSKKVLA